MRPTLVLRLDPGRAVELTQLRITLTFEGFLEGSPEGCSEEVRRDLISDPAWSGVGFRLIDTHGPVLPPYKCVADFRSDKAVRSGISSWVRICWFVDDLERPLRDLLSEALSGINWAGAATDEFIDDNP